MNRQRLLALALIVVGALGLTEMAELAGGLTGVRQLELQTVDWRQKTTKESFQDAEGERRESPITLVLFDEGAVDEWPYREPYPRAILAELVEAISAAGARTIGIDVFLKDLYDSYPDQIEGDLRLRQAIDQAGNVVLAAPTTIGPDGSMLAYPNEFFTEVAADVGAADLGTAFETFRNGTLAVRSGAGLEPSFALAMYAHAEGFDVDSLLLQTRRWERIPLAGLPSNLGTVPPDWWDAAGDASRNMIEFPIRYHGPPSRSEGDPTPPGTFKAVSSLRAVLAAQFWPEMFEDKIVLLGTGHHDVDKFRTPYFDEPIPAVDSTTGSAGQYGWMFGVEIHANALQNMIDGAYVQVLGGGWELLLIVLVATIVAATTFATGAGWGGLATLATGVLVFASAFWVWQGVVSFGATPVLTFDERFLQIPIVTPLLAIALSYLGSVAYVSVVEGREKRFIKGAFGKYVSPAVVADIAADPSALQLGGQKRPLSLFFSDLAGFTTLSERMDPQDLIRKLNEYLTEMTDIVMDTGGTLDKYIGDAIMAFWNAPTPLPDHADRALRTMVLTQRKMDELNERWREEDPDHETLVVRCGVNTGEVVVGNVGGTNRFDYSAIGDAVNLAARLEPANKSYDTLNMCSEFTLAAADASAFRVRELDLMAVKGKDQPVKVFEVLELAGVHLGDAKETAVAEYEAGMTRYKERDWEGARKHFLTALEADPDDGPSRVYADRCEEHIAEPPPPDWDFVVRRTTK